MYRKFTKTDGLKLFIKMDDILAYEEMEDCVSIVTIIGDFEVLDTIEDIFDNNKNVNFSKN